MGRIKVGQVKLSKQEQAKRFREKLISQGRWHDFVRDKTLKHRYKISLTEYNRLFKEQKGLCACCGQSETLLNHQTKELQFLSVDHNHRTGEIRGLVCARCNRFVIPAVEHFSKILPNAVKYLGGIQCKQET